jgi:AcrR family transcriptional regulator
VNDSPSLRERKRTRTRLMIQAEAMRLFAAKGYDATTVEEIAEAAAISPRTFFRYFPTKEDVVLWDEYDPQIGDLLAARPAAEPPAETLRAIIREALGGLQERDRDELLTRTRLLRLVPELRARFLELQAEAGEMMVSLFPDRAECTDELELRVTAAALNAVVVTAIDQWEKAGGKGDVVDVFEQALEALRRAIEELQPTSS